MQLRQVKTTKSLGVLVDEKLTWIDHINNISLNIFRITGVLNRVKHYISQESLKILYLTLVQPHFIYCSIETK